MTQALPAGTLLDDRYILESVLGQGGFGITYAAVNNRIGLKVAVKELFWKDHCERNEADTTVELKRPEEEEAFNRRKESFLKEARTLRDFASEPGVVHVLDYFEANKTAYIVMEYVEGRSLYEEIRTRGAINAEEMFRIFLPVVKSLTVLHQNGIIHRDISPDNLIIRENSDIRLIDFGAARECSENDNSGITRISKDCYSPAELLDKNGKIGPWTDVYSLCATMYYVLATTPPESAVQRLFVDDLKAPSELGCEIDPKYESVIMKGLAMDPGKRYHSMQALAEAMMSALPEKPEKTGPGKGLIAGIAAAIAVIAVLAVLLVSSHSDRNKFKGIETQVFRLHAPEAMTAAEFSDAQTELSERLDEFSGKDNYIMTIDGNAIEITLPYEAFSGECVPDVIKNRFINLTGKDFGLTHEIKGTWEDPASSLYAGENQVSFGQFEDATAVLMYSPVLSGLSKGQRSNLTIDVKTRLDALGFPYAFGMSREADGDFLVQAPVKNLSAFAIYALCETKFCIAGEYDYNNLYGPPPVFEIEENEDGTFGLCFEGDSNDADFIEGLEDAGEETVSFGIHTLSGTDIMLADMPLSEVTSDDGGAAFVFRHLLIEECEEFNEDTRFFLDFLIKAQNETKLPCSCSYKESYYYDAEGNLRLNSDIYLENLKLHRIKKNTEADRLAEKIEAAEGLYSWADGDWIFIDLHLVPDENYTEEIAIQVPKLLKRYDLLNWPEVIIIFTSDEAQNIRLMFYDKPDGWPGEALKYGKYAVLYTDYAKDNKPDYIDDLREWFDSLPEENPF